MIHLIYMYVFISYLICKAKKVFSPPPPPVVGTGGGAEYEIWDLCLPDILLHLRSLQV